MLNEVLLGLTNGINASISWFGQLMNAIPGISQLLLAMFFLYASVRFILGPLALQGGASDMARRQAAKDRTEAYRQARLSQGRQSRR